MIYDTAVAMDNTIQSDGSLIEDGRIRIDRAIFLYNTGAASTLTCPGTFDSIDIEIAPFTHAEAAKRYAISKGVPEGKIYKEETPLKFKKRMSDTIGCAFFIKKVVVIPKNLGSLVVVSSDYHIPRVQEVFRFIYSSDFNLLFEGADTSGINNPRIVQQRSEETERVERFKHFFAGIPPGKDALIMERLFEQHPLYNETSAGEVWFP